MILVTGSNGFIGTGLAAALSMQGLPFRAASRTSIGGSIPVGEINALTDWTEAVDGVSTIIHLAAIAHRAGQVPSAAEYQRVNVDGTVRLAKQAAAAGVRRLVFVSTIGVLGHRTIPGVPLTEASPPAPKSIYARSKHEAELALASVCRASDMEFVIIRPPLVYGASASGNFRKLVRLVSSGWPLPFGSIGNRRNIISLANLAQALIGCATSPRAANETFVVAESQGVSTTEFVNAIATGLGRKPRLLSVPPMFLKGGLRVAGLSAMAPGLLQCLEVNSSKISTTLGWTEAGTTFDNIVREVARFPRSES